MAIDSQDKRAGVQGLHIHPLHPVADGTITQADRQMVVGVYPGILAAAVVGIVRVLIHGSLANEALIGRGLVT